MKKPLCRRLRALACAVLCAYFCIAAAEATWAQSPFPSQTPPPDLAAPSPTPTPLALAGQVIDLERGYVVFSTGDALKMAPQARIVDLQSGGPPTYELLPGFFALASLDPQTGLVTTLQTSQRPIASGTPVAQVPRRYVIAASSPKPNPDLIPRQAILSSVLSKTVSVTVTVQVPANTPFADDVYMATDSSGWNPQAIKMQRIDGLHFRIITEWKGGTDFHYLFTRGSWNSVERERSGLQRKPRELFVPGGDALIIDATVYRWADIL